jgi:hypothetical protein
LTAITGSVSSLRIVCPPLTTPLMMPAHPPIVDPVTVLVHEAVSLSVPVHVHVSPFVPRPEAFSLIEVRRRSGRRRHPGRQVRRRQDGPAKYENEQDDPEGSSLHQDLQTSRDSPAGTAGPSLLLSKRPPAF